jgi:predicted PurR-regulated permease PerM
MDPIPPKRPWRAGELALVVIALMIGVLTAKAAAPLLVPLTAGILIAYALKPLVGALERLHIPRVAGAALVLAAVIGTVGIAVALVRDEAAGALAELPEAARKVRIAAHEIAKQPTNPIGRVREAAAELNRAAAEAVGNPTPTTAAPPPAVSNTSSELQAWGAAQSSKFVGVVADLAVAALLALFVLASGDTFRRKLVHIAGPTLAARRITVEILDEIDAQVQRYLLVMLGTNVLVAVAVWALLAVFGMERAAMWGAITGVLHVIPYLGTAVSAMAIAIAAFVQFGTFSLATLMGTSALAVCAAIGTGLGAWLQGRASNMNPVACSSRWCSSAGFGAAGACCWALRWWPSSRRLRSEFLRWNPSASSSGVRPLDRRAVDHQPKLGVRTKRVRIASLLTECLRPDCGISLRRRRRIQGPRSSSLCSSPLFVAQERERRHFRFARCAVGERGHRLV